MRRKSQSISINTIIIAAIALAVLVVLFIVFTGRFKIFNEGISSTASCENSCKALGKAKLDEYNEVGCKASEKIYVPGKYSDVKNPDWVCCCG